MVDVLAIGVSHNGAMPLSPASRALIAQDWPVANQFALRRALQMAYDAADRICDPDEHLIFDSPNRPLVAGSVRWLAVDRHLRQACELGWLKGITAEWIVLGGKKTDFPCHLVLNGANTSVIAVHLQQENDVPRDSKYRRNARVANEACPLLAGLDNPYEQDVDDARINLLLVHGDKKAEFAELRAYYSVENQSHFDLVIPDIMGSLVGSTAAPVLVDAEAVPEPAVALLRNLNGEEQSSTGA